MTAFFLSVVHHGLRLSLITACLAAVTLSAEGSKEAFQLLTPERIQALPEAEAKAWTRHLERSQQAFAHQRRLLAQECMAVGLEKPRPAPGQRSEFELDGKPPADFFKKPQSLALAKTIISYQTPSGGWSKAVDYNKGPRQAGTHWTSQSGEGWHYCGTLDNRSSTEQIKFLAGVATHRGDEACRQACLRGLHYLLEAQYPNGGWPQNYPIEAGYHEAITLNDNAMIHALEVLAMVTERHADFSFVDEALRQRCAQAQQRGLDCLLAMQVRIAGRLTVWCAQHDPLSLEPTKARLKEPPSLSGGESAELLKFLMRQGPTTSQVREAIEAGLQWLQAHAVHGLRKTKNRAGKTDYAADAASPEVYWARFYDLKTGEAIFPGAQDGIAYKTYREMAAHNKVGYDYLTTRPAELLGKERERWLKRLAKR